MINVGYCTSTMSRIASKGLWKQGTLKSWLHTSYHERSGNGSLFCQQEQRRVYILGCFARRLFLPSAIGRASPVACMMSLMVGMISFALQVDSEASQEALVAMKTTHSRSNISLICASLRILFVESTCM